MFTRNFEKTTNTSTRRTYEEAREADLRRGKHNKTQRKGGKRDFVEQDEESR